MKYDLYYRQSNLDENRVATFHTQQDAWDHADRMGDVPEGCSWDVRETVQRTTYIVAVYHASLAWGGPEEGGWWYNTGSLVRIVRTFPRQEKAYKYARRLNAKLESRQYGPNQGRREKHSVLSDGVYEASVHEDIPPMSFPAERPYYC